MSSFNSTNSFSPSIVNNIAEDVALKLSWEVLHVFHSAGINTYTVDTHHKPTIREVGIQVLRVAADKYERLLV